MQNYRKPEEYQLLNQQLAGRFLSAGWQCRGYQNLDLALYDVTKGLLQYLSHRNKVGLVKYGASALETVSKNWLMQSLTIQSKSSRQSWIEFIEGLSSETNFVLWASENEVTGEVIVNGSLAKEIHERLSAKRIFSLQVTHVLTESVTSPYAVKILRGNIFSASGALVIYGEKFKVPAVIGEHQDIQESSFEPLLEPVAVDIPELKNSYFARFSSETPRLKDRAVLQFQGINAAAVKEDLQLPAEMCFCPSELPFWVLDLFKNWWPEAEDENLIRGLMVLSGPLLKLQPGLAENLGSSYERIRRLGFLG